MRSQDERDKQTVVITRMLLIGAVAFLALLLAFLAVGWLA